MAFPVVRPHSGTFFSRKWSSDLDVEPELGCADATALKTAFVCACRKAEPADAGLRDGTFAAVDILPAPGGGLAVRASSEGREALLEVRACEMCGARTFDRFHPRNGCESVAVEEVMED